MKRLQIFLLVCVVLASAKNKCVLDCLKQVCGSSSNKQQCASDLLKELTCAKDKCNPYYNQDCVDECCFSDNCHQMVSCSKECSFPITKLVNFNFKLNFFSNQSPNYRLKKRISDEEMLSIFDLPSINFSHKGQHHRRRSSSQILLIALPILSMLLLIF